MSEWQPIKTAPQDGTHILAFMPDKIHIVYYGKFSSKAHGNFPWVSSDGGNAWRADIPTHWMPLPEAPK